MIEAKEELEEGKVHPREEQTQEHGPREDMWS